MSVLQLLVVGLVWHVLGLFSDNERTVIDKIVAGEFNKEASIVAITGAGLIVAFMIQRTVRNRGPYHVNQFRVYFTVEDRDITPSLMAKKLEANFHKAFANNRVARVCRPFPDRVDIIQFTVVLWRSKLFKQVMGKERQEHVKLSRPPSGDAVFQAGTLRISGASATDWHFLSGVRSWCIAKTEDCNKFGEPVPQRDDTFFLETAALEEFSFWTYKMLLIGRKQIKRTWRDFLIDALGQLDVAVVPIS